MAFEKGQSGNPSGRAAEDSMSREIKRLAKEKSPEAIKRLAEWMRSDNPKASVSACNAILDRAFGKPKQAIEHSGAIGNNPSEISEAELEHIATGGSAGAAEAQASAPDDAGIH